MFAKRAFDIVASCAGLLCLLPVLIVLAVLIKVDSPGPVFFRQERVGRQGKAFHIHKLRTMVANADRHGAQLTVGQDVRVTRIGAFLRRYKLDELPQLIDVLLGDMSLVGPRPEVPRYVACYPEEERRIVLSVRPGITDYASIKFRRENEILAGSRDPQRTYVEEILPVKLGLYLEYVRNRSFVLDLKIIFRTLMEITR